MMLTNFLRIKKTQMYLAHIRMDAFLFDSWKVIFIYKSNIDQQLHNILLFLMKRGLTKSICTCKKHLVNFIEMLQKIWNYTHTK